jgi:hypothetical protein
MRALKVFGLGTVFSLVGFFILSNLSMMRGPVGFETGTAHATGLSAIIGDILEAVFSYGPVILVGFGVAFLLVRRRGTSKLGKA